MSFSRWMIAAGAGLVLAGSASAQQTVQVDQLGLSFSPQDITIDCGDSVEWVWTQGLHTVTEGTDPVVDPEDAFHYILEDFNVTHEFSTKFLFENPRAGNVYDYVCIPHLAFGMIGSVTVDCPWVNEGFAKAGVNGEPLLYGNGPLTSGSAGEIKLEDAAPSALSILFVGLSAGNAPFKGGTLTPVPILLSFSLTTSGAGELTLPFVTPAGLAGVPVYFQYAIADAAATQGVALSNAMRGDFQ